MKVCAVIDTNVFVSALLSHHDDAATVQVLRAVLDGHIIPLYHKEILDEYREVLLRPKFRFAPQDVAALVDAIEQLGVEVLPHPTGELLADMDDLVFYEVAMEKQDEGAYLVTGNLKHYPMRKFIVTPSEMIGILKEIVG